MFTENEIIDGCLKNDRKMQKVLYDRYASKLYALCLRYAHDRAEADDILQEGFVKVFFKIHQFSRQHSFEGWIKRIIINTAITHYHQNVKHYYQKDIEEIQESEIQGTREIVDGEYSTEDLLQIVQGLSTGYRTVFNLYAVEGYKHKEIAEMLNIDEATSKSQFHRAKKIIQERLQQLDRRNAPLHK
jgi:RNA polymerase sigma-70 factor (ECF subfamily)